MRAGDVIVLEFKRKTLRTADAWLDRTSSRARAMADKVDGQVQAGQAGGAGGVGLDVYQVSSSGRVLLFTPTD